MLKTPAEKNISLCLGFIEGQTSAGNAVVGGKAAVGAAVGAVIGEVDRGIELDDPAETPAG